MCLRVRFETNQETLAEVLMMGSVERKALFVCGGWEGHRPVECVGILAPLLAARGFVVETHTTLEILEDFSYLRKQAVIIPAWTMGMLGETAERNLTEAVRGGVGLAGWHGGMCDAFRSNSEYQFMTGGQFVAHPGGIIAEYDVEISEAVEHSITSGIEPFTMRDTEQYYLHVDPSNCVLATTTFFGGTKAKVRMPAVWTRQWGEGRVAYASFGHTERDFEIEEAREIIVRCMAWAGGAL